MRCEYSRGFAPPLFLYSSHIAYVVHKGLLIFNGEHIDRLLRLQTAGTQNYRILKVS